MNDSAKQEALDELRQLAEAALPLFDGYKHEDWSAASVFEDACEPQRVLSLIADSLALKDLRAAVTQLADDLREEASN